MLLLRAVVVSSVVGVVLVGVWVFCVRVDVGGLVGVGGVDCVVGRVVVVGAVVVVGVVVCGRRAVALAVGCVSGVVVCVVVGVVV